MSAQFQNCFIQKCSKNTSNSSKWYDKELHNLHFKKDRLYKKYMATGCSVLKLKYHKVRNYYFHIINSKKKEHYAKKFSKFKCNIKKSWQCINYLLGRNKKPKSNELHLNCDGKSVIEPIEIANTFNDHFSHTPNNIV